MSRWGFASFLRCEYGMIDQILSEHFPNFKVTLATFGPSKMYSFFGRDLIGQLNYHVDTKVTIERINLPSLLHPKEQWKRLMVKYLIRKARYESPLNPIVIFDYFYLTKKPWSILEVRLSFDMDFVVNRFMMWSQISKISSPDDASEYKQELMAFQKQLFATVAAHNLKNLYFLHYRHAYGVNQTYNVKFPTEFLSQWFMEPKTMTVGIIPLKYDSIDMLEQKEISMCGAIFLVKSHCDNGVVVANVFHLLWKDEILIYRMESNEPDDAIWQEQLQHCSVHCHSHRVNYQNDWLREDRANESDSDDSQLHTYSTTSDSDRVFSSGEEEEVSNYSLCHCM